MTILNSKKKHSHAGRQKTHDGFVNLTAKLGVGADNLLSRGGYYFDTLTNDNIELESMYRGSWIVGAAIDSYAEDMTRAGIDIVADIDPDRIANIQTMLTRKKIWGNFLDVIKWGRLYGGAALMIDIKGQDTATPLDISTVGKDQFLGVRVYDRWQLQTSFTDKVTTTDSYGLPKFYTVTADASAGEIESVTYHHSRVIRFTGIKLPYRQAITEEMWGESILERMYDRILAYDTATMASANLIQKASLRVMKIENLRRVLAEGGKAQENLLAMFYQMRLLQNSDGITLLDKNDDFQTIDYSFGGVTGIVDSLKMQIVAALESTELRLGKSAGGMGSTGDGELRTYYDNIKAKQESSGLREGLHKILMILYRSEYGESAPEGFDFEFVSLWQTSEKEKADIANTVTTLISTAYEKGVIDQAVALKELQESSITTGIFTNISDEDIEQSELEPPPMPVDGDIPEDGLSEPATEEPANDSQSVFDKLKGWLSGK